MIWLLLGVLVLALLWAIGRWGVNKPPRQLRWTGLALLAGLCLALAVWLAVTGRLAGAAAFATGAFALYGRYRWIKGIVERIASAGRAPGGQGQSQARQGNNGIDEAYAILGLKPGANKDAVLAAHRRLMRLVHPDHGGTDYLAARINQARDVLLEYLEHQ